MDLTSLVTQLRQISEPAHGRQPATRADGAYSSALRAYWSGKPKVAVETVSTLLADEPDCGIRFAAYRLWIECLADLKERGSLALLSEHLFLRGQADPDDQETFLALRGLIDLELDTVQAARLAARALREATHNPYALEMVQIFDNRVFERDVDQPEAPLLLTSRAPVMDYFQWLNLARALMMFKDTEALDEVFDHVRECFRGSPLPSLFAYHRYVESRDYSAAAIMASELARSFPENADFLYYHAYALFEDGDYPASRRVLNATLGISGDQDPEILSLLGHCNAKLGDAERARHYLERSSTLLRMEGLPSSHMRLEMSEVEEDLRKGQPDPRREVAGDPAIWLVELSARRYLEMKDSTEESLARLIRPMGIGAKPGDSAFFGYRSPGPDGERVWKIITHYTVDSEPMWHPTQRYHSALRLAEWYPEGVAVPNLVSMARGRTTQERAYEAFHKQFGVMELDERGLKTIEQALRTHYEDRFMERRVDGGRTRTDVG